jgi:hypothetical protein
MLPEDGRRPKHVGAFLSVLVCVFKIQKVLVHLLVFLGEFCCCVLLTRFILYRMNLLSFDFVHQSISIQSAS